MSGKTENAETDNDSSNQIQSKQINRQIDLRTIQESAEQNVEGSLQTSGVKNAQSDSQSNQGDEKYKKSSPASCVSVVSEDNNQVLTEEKSGPNQTSLNDVRRNTTKGRPQNESSRDKLDTAIERSASKSNTRTPTVDSRGGSHSSIDNILTGTRPVKSGTERTEKEETDKPLTKNRPTCQSSREKPDSQSRPPLGEWNRDKPEDTDNAPAIVSGNGNPVINSGQTRQPDIDKQNNNTRAASSRASIDKQDNHSRAVSQGSIDKQGNHNRTTSQASTDKQIGNSRPASQASIDKPGSNSRTISQASTDKQGSNSSQASQASIDKPGSNRRPVRQASIDKPGNSRPASQASIHKQGSNSRTASQAKIYKQDSNSRTTSQASTDKPDSNSRSGSQASIDKQSSNSRRASQASTDKPDNSSRSASQPSANKKDNSSIAATTPGSQPTIEKQDNNNIGASRQSSQPNIEKQDNNSRPASQAEKKDQSSKAASQTEKRDHNSRPASQAGKKDQSSKAASQTEKRGHNSRPASQTEKRDQNSRPAGQTEKRDINSRLASQTEKSDITSRPVSQTEKSDQNSRPAGQTDNRDQNSRPDSQTEKSTPTRQRSDSEKPTSQSDKPTSNSRSSSQAGKQAANSTQNRQSDTPKIKSTDPSQTEESAINSRPSSIINKPTTDGKQFCQSDKLRTSSTPQSQADYLTTGSRSPSQTDIPITDSGEANQTEKLTTKSRPASQIDDPITNSKPPSQTTNSTPSPTDKPTTERKPHEHTKKPTEKSGPHRQTEEVSCRPSSQADKLITENRPDSQNEKVSSRPSSQADKLITENRPHSQTDKSTTKSRPHSQTDKPTINSRSHSQTDDNRPASQTGKPSVASRPHSHTDKPIENTIPHSQSDNRRPSSQTEKTRTNSGTPNQTTSSTPGHIITPKHIQKPSSRQSSPIENPTTNSRPASLEKLLHGEELVKQVTRKLLAENNLISPERLQQKESACSILGSQSEPNTPAISRTKLCTKVKTASLDTAFTDQEEPTSKPTCKVSRKEQPSPQNNSKSTTVNNKMSFSKGATAHAAEYSKFETEASRCSSRNSAYSDKRQEGPLLPKQSPEEFNNSHKRSTKHAEVLSRTSSRHSNYEVSENETISDNRRSTFRNASHVSGQKVMQEGNTVSHVGSPIQTPIKGRNERLPSINAEESVNSNNRRRSVSRGSRKSTGNSGHNNMEDDSQIIRQAVMTSLSKESIRSTERQNLSDHEADKEVVPHRLAEYNRSQMASPQGSTASTRRPGSCDKNKEKIDYTHNSQETNVKEQTPTAEDISKQLQPPHKTNNLQTDSDHGTNKSLKQFIRQDSVRSDNLSQRSTPLPYSTEASRVSSPVTKEQVLNLPATQARNADDIYKNEKKEDEKKEASYPDHSVAQDTLRDVIKGEKKTHDQNFNKDFTSRQISSTRSLPYSHQSKDQLIPEATKWSGPGHMYMSVQNLSHTEDRLLVCPIKPPRRSRSEAMISDLCDQQTLEKPKIANKPNVQDAKYKEALLQRANTEHPAQEDKPDMSSVRKFMSETQLNYNTVQSVHEDTSLIQTLSTHPELPNVIPKYENMSSKKPILRAKSERYLSSAPKSKSNSRSMHELRCMAMSANDLAGRSISMMSGLSDRSETMSELSQLTESSSEQSVFNESSSRATVLRKRPVDDPSERWIKDIISSHGDFHLQGLLTCFYCKNLMKDPQILTSCLHSFCQPCLQKQSTDTMEDTEGTLCPKCGTFSSKDRIRDNIFFDELLDIYNLNKDGAHKECRQCPDKLEPSWICLDCKIDLCEKCHTIHLMIPLLQGHKVIQLNNVDAMVVDRLVFCDLHPDEPIKFNCKECETVLCIKCKVTEHDTHCIETVGNSLKRLMPLMYNITEKLEEKLQNLRDKIKEVDFKIDCTRQMFTKTGNDIDTTAEEYIARIRQTQQQLKHDLRIKEEAEMKMLHDFMTKLQFKQNQGNNLRDLVTISIMKGRQTCLLAEVQGGIFNNVRDYDIEIQKESSIQTAHPELKPNTRVDDIFKEGILGKTNYHIINVLSSGSMPSYKKFQLVRFEEYFTQPLQKMLEVNLPDQCVSITLVCDQIWAALPYTSIIHVYDRFGELIRQIPVEDRQPRSIHQTNDGDVIMACQYTGLFVLNPQTGQIVTKLTDGKFSDVCVRDERIFGLEYNKKAVIVFRKVGVSTSDCCGVQWLQIDTIDISLAQQVDSVSTLLVNEEYDDNIYICSYNAHTLFHFNQHGELLGQYGRRGKEIAGELYYPMLCTADKFGFILLADGENRRLQILDIWGMWREILLEGLRKPYNVTIDSKQSLWITQFNDQYQTWQLVKYAAAYLRNNETF